MTLSSVFAGMPAQAGRSTQQFPAKTLSASPQNPDDHSKEFYNQLRSSVGHNNGEARSEVRERGARTNKEEKAGKKEELRKKPDTRDTNDVVTPSQTEQLPSPSSALALLGLPTTPTAKVEPTGKTKDADGKAPLSSMAALSSASLPGFGLQLGEMLNAKDDNGAHTVNTTESPADDANGDNIQSVTTSASANGAPPLSAQGSLAFALRLNGSDGKAKFAETPEVNSSPEPIADVAQANTTDAKGATIVGAAAGSELKEQSHQHGDGGFEQNLYEVLQAQGQKTADTPQSVSEQPVHTSAAQLRTEGETVNTEPVRNVQMQVVGENNSRVDVRLIERGGELRVSVKSGDLNLARGLQDHMGELTSRLEQERFQTEIWMPKLGESAKPESGTSGFSSGGNNGSQGSAADSNQQGRRQQQDKPDWVDVLENSTRGAGKANGTWLQ